jgi:hypothetical protein
LYCSSKGEPEKEPGATGSSSLNVVDASDSKSDAKVFCYFGAPENWLYDSGTTNHMSPFGSDFKDYVKFVEEHNVTLGDCTTRLSILGKGTIKRWVETAPHSYRQLVLSDVLHVKGIQCCFLSASKFDDKGFTLTGEMMKMKETNSLKRERGEMKRKGKIFCVVSTFYSMFILDV